MARKKRHEEHENHERWLVSYADFITLLFAFFTVLYATSAADVKKQQEFQDSIKRSFAGGLGMNNGSGGSTEASGEENFSRSAASLIAPLIQTFPKAGSGSGEVQGYIEQKLEKEMPDEGKDTIKNVYHDTIGVRIQMAASKLFPVGSAELMSESAVALDRLGQLLKETDRRIIIEGHTDNQPIKTDKFPSNWELSAARATKIVRYLIARHKIPASHLTAVAYADQKPVVPNTSEENRTKNRRIEVMIVTDSKKPESESL